MLPGLERLSLGDATADFYELTAAERQRVVDDGLADPITLDNPTHVMTFRVQMDTPNPEDGTPRYAYYSPAPLWDWVRQPSSNGKLPHNPSQKILKEDWYRLHANYDPRGAVPYWVNGLEHEHLFLARMAQAEQRVRDRLAREAEERRQREEEERRAKELPALLQSDAPEAGLDREHFAIVRWRFWMAGHWSNPGSVHTKLKQWFGTLIQWLQSEPPFGEKAYNLDDIDDHTRPYGAAWPGLAVRLRQVRSAYGRREFTEQLFAARMPRDFAALFAKWATSIVEAHGYDDFLRRAHRHYGLFGGAKYGCTFDHPHVVELGTPVEDPEWCEMPAMTDEEYRASQVSFIRAPAGWHGGLDVFDTVAAKNVDKPFPPEPVVRLRWRFWLKKDGVNKPTVNQMRTRFVAHVMQAPPEGMGATSRAPWNGLKVQSDLWPLVVTDVPDGVGARDTIWIWVYRFVLELNKRDADAFVAHFRARSALLGKASYLYQRIFEIDSPVKTADGAWEYPVERWESTATAGGSSARGRTVALRMSQQEYDAWNTPEEEEEEEEEEELGETDSDSEGDWRADAEADYQAMVMDNLRGT